MSGRMTLFGGFKFEYAGKAYQITSSRIQSLLAYLGLNHREPQSRQHLAFFLWADSTEKQAFNNLRTLLHRVNAVFPDDVHILKVDSQTVAWHPDAQIAIDVVEFQEAIARAKVATTKDDQAIALEYAIELYKGDLLPDSYDEWVFAEREKLGALLFTALEQLIQVAEAQQDYPTAIRLAQRLLNLDSLNEMVYLILMRLHAANGDHASAIRVFQQCESILEDELGTQPNDALRQAYQRLMTAETPVAKSTPPKAAGGFVGREQEWKQIHAVWNMSISEKPQMITLSGEAGIGKTRLAQEMLAWARKRGFVTADTQCYYAEGDLAYAPVTDLLRSDVIAANIDQLDKQWLTEIARLASDIIPSELEIEAPPPLVEAWQRRRLFEALARVILASQRPILLLIDDLQWCDRDTMEWLHFLLRFQSDAQLMIMATVRTEEINNDHPILAMNEALNRENRLTNIDITPLSHEETHRLAEHMLNKSLSALQADTLYSETEGNPLFIVEMIRANDNLNANHHQSATSKASNINLPPTVLSVITRRFRQLSENARSMMNIAAVIGRSFSYDVLAHAADLTETELVDGLGELWQSHILREQGNSSYDFTHGKLCTVAYSQLSSTHQRVIHRRVAKALETVHSNQLDTVSGQIAMHYQKAHIADQAAKYYQQAATYASNLYANYMAIHYYRQALELLPPSDLVARQDILCVLGHLLHFIGRYDESRETYHLALELTDDDMKHAEILSKIGNVWREHHHYVEALQSYDEAENILLQLNDESSSVLMSWAQIRLERLNALYWLGKAEEMIDLLEEVSEVIEAHGTTYQIAHLHQVISMVMLRINRYSYSAEVLEHVDMHVKLMGQLIDIEKNSNIHFGWGFMALWLTEDLERAEEHLRTALSLAKQQGDVSLETRSISYLAICLRLQGKVEQMKAYAPRCLETAEICQMQDYIGAAYSNLAWVSWLDDDIELAQMHIQLAIEAWKRLTSSYPFEWTGRLVWIAILLDQDRLDETIPQVQAVLHVTQRHLPQLIESALESAIQMYEANNRKAAYKFLESAIKASREYNYL